QVARISPPAGRVAAGHPDRCGVSPAETADWTPVSTPEGPIVSERLDADLALLDRETTCLLVTASGLTDPDLRRPSLCGGWTRAHVLTHLARNADALLSLVHWAADGRPREAYASEQQRAADIEAGVGRNTEEVLRDVRES